MIKAILLSFLFPLFFAYADFDFTFLPNSRHQQYQSYALILDDHAYGLMTRKQSILGQMAGHIAFLEFPTLWGSPQFVFSTSINTILKLKHYDIFTDTADTYIHFLLEFTIDPTTRFSFGFRHQSGHVTEDTPDQTLHDLNCGIDAFYLRFVKDFQQKLRLGATIAPVIESIPHQSYWEVNQFIEWFPWGVNEKEKVFNPYISYSLSESGWQSFTLTHQIQIGAYLGKHFSDQHATTIRVVAGYYNGLDLRLKYATYRDKHGKFFYLGLMADF